MGEAILAGANRPMRTVNDAIAALAAQTLEVGDTLTTARTNLGANWILCNGATVPSGTYPALAPLLYPAFHHPHIELPVFRSAYTHVLSDGGNVTPNSTNYKTDGTAVLARVYPENTQSSVAAWYYNADYANSTAWTAASFPSSRGFKPENIKYENGYWVAASGYWPGSGSVILVTIWVCTGAPHIASNWSEVYTYQFPGSYYSDRGILYFSPGIAFNGTRWGMVLTVAVGENQWTFTRCYATTSGADPRTGWTGGHTILATNTTVTPAGATRLGGSRSGFVGLNGYWISLSAGTDTLYHAMYSTNLTSWTITGALGSGNSFDELYVAGSEVYSIFTNKYLSSPTATPTEYTSVAGTGQVFYTGSKGGWWQVVADGSSMYRIYRISHIRTGIREGGAYILNNSIGAILPHPSDANKLYLLGSRPNAGNRDRTQSYLLDMSVKALPLIPGDFLNTYIKAANGI